MTVITSVPVLDFKRKISEYLLLMVAAYATNL